MMRPALYILTATICLGSASVFGQEVISPLETNPLLENADPASKKHHKHGEPHVQKLPFFDDFSHNPGVYPNDTMWLDQDVYISRTMAISPPSVGAVVFDGLNMFGRPYRGIEDPSSYASDTLTSTYIDLSSFDNADSLYLSFFYQPKGLGIAPAKSDSLILQFKRDSSSDAKWDQVWFAEGSGNAPFKLVMIPVKTAAGHNYFNGKFQFRFVAYSSQEGNLDHWLVDYVYLQQGRTLKENKFQDVAIDKEALSVLNTYYSMPVRQAAAMTDPFRDEVSIFGTNNSDVVKNVAFGYRVVDASTGASIASNLNSQGDNLNVGQHREFKMNNLLAKDKLTGDKLTWLVKTSVKNVPDGFPVNDTGIHVQEFGDYLAYDDGTAEAAYGIANGTFSKVAVRFILPQPDTLYGFAIHFSFGTKDVSKKTVTLAVWDKLTEPGLNENDQPIRKVNYITPQYTNRINGYHYFKLEEPLAVKEQFYVGWMQTSDFMLNIGADFNYADISTSTNNTNLMVSTQGKWYNSSLNIAPMIRAYLGADFVAAVPKSEKPKMQVQVYPNPTSGILHVETDPSMNVEASIFSLDGRQLSGIMQYRGSATLNYSGLKPGLYLLQLRADNGLVSHEKVVVR